MPPPVDPELATMQLKNTIHMGAKIGQLGIILRMQAAVGGDRNHVEDGVAQRSRKIRIRALEVQEQRDPDAARAEHAENGLCLGVAKIGAHPALAPSKIVGREIHRRQNLETPVNTTSMRNELKCPMLAS